MLAYLRCSGGRRHGSSIRQTNLGLVAQCLYKSTICLRLHANSRANTSLEPDTLAYLSQLHAARVAQIRDLELRNFREQEMEFTLGGRG
jgi:hypothetical protein